MGKVVIDPHLVLQRTRLQEHLPPITPETYRFEDVEARRLQAAADLLEEVAAPTRARWKADPRAWVAERLDGFIWSKQGEILDTVRDNEETAVHTCHNIGKSWSAALAVCWWLDVHEPGEAFVVTTAPTGAQVKAILWRYINRMHSQHDLPGRTNMTEWYIDGELVALGRKPAEYSADAFQGIHARFVLVIIDEACGVLEKLWDAASTLTSNEGSRTLAIGNPDDPQSMFAKVCTPGSGWAVIGIGAFDTPNFTDEPVPDKIKQSLISRKWVEGRARVWGTDSPLYISKVLGKFPLDAEDGVIPASFVMPCRYLGDDPNITSTMGVRRAGLDVGETTDRTVLFVRDGMRVIAHHVISHQGDAMNAVGEVARYINQYGITEVVVDVIGIGWGVYSRLRELSRVDNPTGVDVTHDARLVRFSAGEQAHDKDRFINKRSELWWEVGREHSRTRAWDLSYCDDDVIAELTCPKYRIEGSHSRVQVESKSDVRERLGRSSDLADALLMSFYTGDPPMLPGAFSSRNLELAGTRL